MDENNPAQYEEGGITALISKASGEQNYGVGKSTIGNLFDFTTAAAFETKAKTDNALELLMADNHDLSASDEEYDGPKNRLDKKALKQKRLQEKAATSRQTVFVGNVPVETKKKELEKRFNKYGTVESVRIRGLIWEDSKAPKRALAIRKDVESQTQTCIAYIKFGTKEEAEKALAENNTKFRERTLRVNMSTVNNKTSTKKRDLHSIFIGNVARRAQEDDIREIFKDCGTIENIRLVTDKDTGLGQGFGYVQFESYDSVELALTLNDTVNVMGRELRVRRCRRPKKAEMKLRPLKRKNIREFRANRDTERAVRRKEVGKLHKPSLDTFTKPKFKTPKDTRKRASVFEKQNKGKSRKDRQRERKEKFRALHVKEREVKQGAKKQSADQKGPKQLKRKQNQK